MFIKRTKEGGFINERYEKWNRIAGIFAIILILSIFLCLLAMLFMGDGYSRSVLFMPR